MNFKKIICVPTGVAVLILISGCSSLRTSTPFPLEQHIVIEKRLPEELPKQSARFPGSQFVLIPQDSAVGLVVPIPFVTDIALDMLHDNEAADLAKRYAQIDPYIIVKNAMLDSRLIASDGHGISAKPFAYMIDCKDDRYRMALVVRMKEKEWIGRYVVHLPTTYTPEEIAAGSSSVIERMGRDLTEASVIIRRMIELDSNGKLNQPLYKANVGSYNLACSNVGGLLPATLLLSRNALVVEEDDQHIIIRGTGDMTKSGASGGLIFGMHYLRKDQLHTFDRLQGK
ncbi:MAG: hypothetical protein LBE30_00180 [Comamonas sp.]|jgi:hypothetical protein|nr:hypothetical protein [Comamonas sp.]